MVEEIPFIDLQRQYHLIADEINEGIIDICERGHFVMGKEVFELEEKLAEYVGVNHCMSCSSGTDALLLSLMALEIEPQDVVFVPGYSFVATAGAISLLGAVPYFIDVGEDFLMAEDSLAQAIHETKTKGLRAKAVIAVDLFGRPCQYDQLREVATDLKIIADAAQSFGGQAKNQKVGQMGDITTTSFYPAKPLGCYGEGGAIFCQDEKISHEIKIIRSHGEESRYNSVKVGLNARLDSLQALVLLKKMTLFDEELIKRNRIATMYNQWLEKELGERIICPPLGREADTSFVSSWAQYTVRLEHRDKIQEFCKDKGVPSVVYYPWTINKQKAYSHYPCVGGGVVVSEKLARQALSLPMFPYLSETEVERVASVVIDAVKTVT